MPALDLIAWFLLVLWAVFLAGGLLVRRARPHKRRLPAWMQAASAFTLLLLAWYGFILTRPGAETARYAFGIAAAVTFNLIGSHLPASAHATRPPWFGIPAPAVRYLLFVAAIATSGPAPECVRLPSLHLRRNQEPAPPIAVERSPAAPPPRTSADRRLNLVRTPESN